MRRNVFLFAEATLIRQRDRPTDLSDFTIRKLGTQIATIRSIDQKNRVGKYICSELRSNPIFEIEYSLGVAHDSSDIWSHSKLGVCWVRMGEMFTLNSSARSAVLINTDFTETAIRG